MRKDRHRTNEREAFLDGFTGERVRSIEALLRSAYRLDAKASKAPRMDIQGMYKAASIALALVSELFYSALHDGH